MSHDTPLNARTEGILRRLVRRDASGPALRKMLARTNAADIAAAMQHLTWAEQRTLYRAIDDRDHAAEVLAMLPEVSIRQVTEDLTEEVVADLLDRLELDDATDVVALLSDDLRARVLAEMDDADEAGVRQLLAWPADSAGGIMSTDFFAMPDTATCGAAVRALQRSTEDRENVHYVYVLDQDQRLVGVVSLRTLLVRPPNTPLLSVMTRDPIAVGPRDDQEEVARYVARYDLLAIPVVDEGRRLLGIVTVDDVVDVLREEAAEDLYKMAGMSDGADPLTRSVWTQARTRFGWLLATLVGGLVASLIIGQFEDTLSRVTVLAGFIPVVMGMGGNVGVQAATVAVRGLATGHVQLGGLGVFVLREFRTGLLLAVGFGVIQTGFGLLREPGEPMLGVAVGASVFAAIVAASVIGAVVPLSLWRLRLDPAVATGPLVTTLIDITGILIYFALTITILGV